MTCTWSMWCVMCTYSCDTTQHDLMTWPRDHEIMRSPHRVGVACVPTHVTPLTLCGGLVSHTKTMSPLVRVDVLQGHSLGVWGHSMYRVHGMCQDMQHVYTTWTRVSWHDNIMIKMIISTSQHQDVDMITCPRDHDTIWIMWCEMMTSWSLSPKSVVSLYST